MQEYEEKPILNVKGLKTYFHTEDGIIKAVDDVDFHVKPGEIVGLVGESGCGKTVTSLSILGLIPAPGKVGGEIKFLDHELLKLSRDELSTIRGNQISMIFQQPQSSLNPVLTVGDQIAEVLHIHQDIAKEEAWDKAVEMLQLVGIPSPEKKIHAYPHEMSGGQAQRVMIAMALILKPTLLIADEPTTALDVTVQAQILDLMRELNQKMNTAIVLITHDLGVIADMVNRVAVMYAGKIVEQTSVEDLFAEPLHPYTQGLIGSIPILGKKKRRLEIIPGIVPNLIDLPEGCAFASRCNKKMDVCEEITPELTVQKSGHEVRCWLYSKNSN
ncbi:MAG TPA: ABC transporter ATP-binding protein [Anaerolineales bacterium]|nr:ABC transporter ATP-binding protein [Anaerolineales bacterium]